VRGHVEQDNVWLLLYMILAMIYTILIYELSPKYREDRGIIKGKKEECSKGHIKWNDQKCLHLLLRTRR
jgi:hypothetical protein